MKSKRRGSRTRGWKKQSPRRGSPRVHLMEQCGKDCFLQPTELKFPICKKCGKSQCSCKPECSAIIAAKVRASQYRHKRILSRARKAEKKYC